MGLDRQGKGGLGVVQRVSRGKQGLGVVQRESRGTRGLGVVRRETRGEGVTIWTAVPNLYQRRLPVRMYFAEKPCHVLAGFPAHHNSLLVPGLIPQYLIPVRCLQYHLPQPPISRNHNTFGFRI